MGCSLFPGHYLIYSLNNPTRYSPHLTDGEAESREFHPLTSNYYRGEIRFQPRPSLFCNISSNLLPGTSSHNSPCTMMPLLLDLSGPYLFKCLSSLHSQHTPAVNICWGMIGLISYFIFPQSNALIVLPYDPTWTPSQLQCRGQVQWNRWTSLGHAKMCWSSTMGSEEWRFHLLVPCWCDFLFTAHSHLIVFS